MGNCFGIGKINPDLSESLLENSTYGNNYNYRLQLNENKIETTNNQLDKLHQNVRSESLRNEERFVSINKILENIEANQKTLIENDKVLMNLYNSLKTSKQTSQTD
jgi:hypothetical protein